MIALIIKEVHLDTEVAIPLLLIVLAVNFLFAVLQYKRREKQV